MKEIVARVKKTYAMLNESLSRAEAKYGSGDTWYIILPAGGHVQKDLQGK